MSKVICGWTKFYKCPKCENEKTTFVEYKDYIKLKCTKCKFMWERGKKDNE